MKCGIDIIHQERVEDLVTRRGPDYLTRIWSRQEVLDCTRKDGSLKYDSLAARYAAKEAVSKAFGTGFGREGVHLDEIEIHINVYGAPFVILHGTTLEFYQKHGMKEISVSLSHHDGVAVAMCIIVEA